MVGGRKGEGRMHRVRVNIFDRETGFIAFHECSNREEAISLSGIYSAEDVLSGDNEWLRDLVKNCLQIKALEHVLPHLDQENVTIEVTLDEK